MITPTRMIKITDYKNKLYQVPKEMSDTQEGCIFYLGTLRGASVMGFEEILKLKLDNALKFISELATQVQSAKAASEAAASGQNTQMVEVSVQLSTAMENLNKWQKYNQLPMVQPPVPQPPVR